MLFIKFIFVSIYLRVSFDIGCLNSFCYFMFGEKRIFLEYVFLILLLKE